jgi:hypothetical protein
MPSTSFTDWASGIRRLRSVGNSGESLVRLLVGGPPQVTRLDLRWDLRVDVERGELALLPVSLIASSAFSGMARRAAQ